MRTALFDCDYLLYRVGHGKKDLPLEEAIVALDELIYTSLEPVQPDVTLFFLSDPNGNFRHRLYPEYKANRAPKPDHFEGLWDHMVGSWCAEVCQDMEADDAVSLECVDENHTIVGIDKDLLQIPGNHYDPVKNIHRYISEFAGLYNLYTQVLMGDSTDNIKGCKGIGAKKAEKLLKDCTNEEQMFQAVRKAYNNDSELLLNTVLVWLLSRSRSNMILNTLR